jgi:uncharacterized membrane protein
LETDKAKREDRETARIESFSDGVFAIAITLLVLELHVPKPAELGAESLNAVLLKDWPSYFGFALSYFTILIMWFNHHKLFTYIKSSDNVLPYVNGFLLFFITLTPWPTALMAEYIGEGEERAAIHVFAAFFMMMAVAFNLLWRYASYHGRLLGPDPDMKAVQRINRMYLLGPTGYGVGFVLSFISVPACLIVNLALAIFFAFTGLGGDRSKRPVGAG